MSIRLVITITATPGKGNELAAQHRDRIQLSLQDDGCEQFDILQSVLDPDRVVILERWRDAAALAAHAELQKARPKIPAGLAVGISQREDYVYNRTR